VQECLTWKKAHGIAYQERKVPSYNYIRKNHDTKTIQRYTNTSRAFA
jgi:hypothetical protein